MQPDPAHPRPGARGVGRRLDPRRLDPRRQAALIEAAVLGLTLLAFTRIHALVGTNHAVATDNAGALQAVERALRIDVELGINRWLVDHPALITPAVAFYRGYYVVLVGVLVWVFLRHAGGVYLQVRRTFVALCGIALLVYWAVPMSPPRFALAGAVDVVTEHDVLPGRAPRAPGSWTAMPSVHVAWSAWAAYAAWLALRRRHPRAAWAVWTFPLLMVADVFATANHYVLDVVGSAVVLAAAIGVARLWERLAGLRLARLATDLQSN